MKIKDSRVVKSILGEDIFEELKKSSIYKPETKTALQPEEIRVALEIVPRSVLSFLFANLKHHNVNSVVDLDLPWAVNAKMHVNKLGADNYSGEITKDGKRIYEFQHRSLPSIGLIFLSIFELYDLDMLNEIKEKPTEPAVQGRIDKLQDLIDSRLMMNNLIRDVVDRRISEREAIGRLIKEKLSEHIKSVSAEESRVEEPKEEPVEDNKKSKLRQFLESREKKRQDPIEIDKGEDIKCPDCKSTLHKKESNEIIPCICYGEWFNKSIKISKNSNGKVNIKFPKTFDIDNIEMLLDAVKK